MLFILALGFIVFLYFLYKNIPQNNSFEPKVAVVNGDSVLKSEFDKKVTFSKNFYTYKKQDLNNYSTLEKDILDKLIEDKLIKQYAKNNNISVTDKEILTLYTQKTSKTSEDKLLQQLKDMYDMEKQDYLEVLRKDILREKVQAAVKMPLLTWLEQQKAKADIKIN